LTRFDHAGPADGDASPSLTSSNVDIGERLNSTSRACIESAMWARIEGVRWMAKQKRFVAVVEGENGRSRQTYILDGDMTLADAFGRINGGVWSHESFTVHVDQPTMSERIDAMSGTTAPEEADA
jgi:hypothetical protein